jgi:hypothetical protein
MCHHLSSITATWARGWEISLFDPDKRSIGIIDWELAGYVPEEWIKTKFNLSSGMNFPDGKAAEPWEWRRLGAHRLEEIRSTNAIDNWVRFRKTHQVLS